ncbi:MAG: hypothetical protein JSU87_05320 [Gemmatimonadota bacterium]|nr:MAG: hypothetical protein JSU87_05320 [Gemmatimonadota bacterium]
MDSFFGRIFILLVGALMGYCAGFKDAQTNERMIFERVVGRVENFADHTVGEPSRAREGAAEEVGN